VADLHGVDYSIGGKGVFRGLDIGIRRGDESLLDDIPGGQVVAEAHRREVMHQRCPDDGCGCVEGRPLLRRLRYEHGVGWSRRVRGPRPPANGQPHGDQGGDEKPKTERASSASHKV
jgi:hypothetical protein